MTRSGEEFPPPQSPFPVTLCIDAIGPAHPVVLGQSWLFLGALWGWHLRGGDVGVPRLPPSSPLPPSRSLPTPIHPLASQALGGGKEACLARV